MTPLAWLLGRFLPACGAAGAQGIPSSAIPTDLTRIVRPPSPNSALAAPAGFAPVPDLVLPEFPYPPQQVWRAVDQAASAQARTYRLSGERTRATANWVVRSALLNFPDVVSAEALPTGDGHTRLILYSHSVYGYSDFGVNRRRLERWVSGIRTALDAKTV